MRIVTSLLAVLFLGTAAAAELEVPAKDRVKNLPSGCCVWAAVESLGNVHRIDKLRGITQYRHDTYGAKPVWVEGSYVVVNGLWTRTEGPHWAKTNDAPGNETNVPAELTRLGVRHKLQARGDYDLTLLKAAVRDALGAAVAVRDYPKPGDHHMVALTDLTDDRVVFIDSLDLKKHGASRDWFDRHWMGFTVVVYPDEKKEPPAK